MSSTRRRTLLSAAALLLAGATALDAHDFWLVPDAFRVAAGAQIEVRGQTSSRFPTSEAAVAPERIAAARIYSAGGVDQLGDVGTSGSSLLIRHRPRDAGQRVIAVALHPHSVRESAEGFRRYLVLEGAPEALRRYEREGKLPEDSITRRYTKYAKTLVEVGSDGPRSFSRIVGHTAEFVPLRDPAALSAGDTLPVRLLYRGEPLGGAHIHAGSVPGLADDAEEQVVSLDADANGVVRVPIDRAGLWNVRAIHIVPADAGSGADWDTHWVTLVFGVEDRDGVGGDMEALRARERAAADSAAVAAVVHRFHEALETADSMAALDLLTGDAIILESGGVETKSEYRSHHLPGDIAFASAVDRETGPLRVTVRGDVAWATSTSTTRGTYRDRELNLRGAELMVLVRAGGAWRISAIHWSSRALRP